MNSRQSKKLRIAKGIFSHHAVIDLKWSEYHIEADLQQLIQNSILDIDIVRILLKNPQFNQNWDGIFSYKGSIIEGNSIWVMFFYDSFVSLVIFRKKIHLNSQQAQFTPLIPPSSDSPPRD